MEPEGIVAHPPPGGPDADRPAESHNRPRGQNEDDHES